MQEGMSCEVRAGLKVWQEPGHAQVEGLRKGDGR